jgi:adenylate cyclase
MSEIKLTVEEITWLKEQVKKKKEEDFKNNNKGHFCQMCGLTQIINVENDPFNVEENQWHHLTRQESLIVGYGSKLDGTVIDFELCDTCLNNLIKSFRFPLDDEDFLI